MYTGHQLHRLSWIFKSLIFWTDGKLWSTNMCYHAKFRQNPSNGFWDILIFRFSRRPPFAIWEFEIFKVLVSYQVGRARMHHRTKFHQNRSNGCWDIRFKVFSTRCDVIMHLALMPWCQSICLSVTFVHCGHRVRCIPDIFACLDRWMSLLLTDNTWPRSSDGMMPGFLVEEGGYGKSGNCSDMAYFTYFFLSMDHNHVTYLFTWKILKLFSVISVENALCQKTVPLITTSA